MMTPARVRGGTVRAAHPRFESAPNVSDAPLRVTLGLGNTQTHTHTRAGTHRLLIKTCCISILPWFYVASENRFDLVKKKTKVWGRE